MSQESISVVYEALWNAKSDQTVYDAVERIAKKINEILNGAVNFGASAEALTKLADSFKNVAAKVDAVQAAVKASTEATKKQAGEAQGLLAIYSKINEQAQKATNSGPGSIEKELKQRQALLRLLEKMEQSTERFPGVNIASAKNLNLQMVDRLKQQLVDALKQNNNLAEGSQEHFSQSVRYATRLKEIYAEIARFSDGSLGRAGIEQQVKQYERLRKIYDEMLGDNTLKSDPLGASLLNETMARLESMKGLKTALADLDKASGASAMERSARQLAALEKLNQAYEQQKINMETTTGKGALADEARIKTHQNMLRLLEKRMALEQGNTAVLEKEYTELLKGKYIVEQLTASYSKLMAELSAGVSSKSLVEYSEKLMKIKQAQDTLKKMSGFDLGGMSITDETAKLLSMETELKKKQSEFTREIKESESAAKSLRETIAKALSSYARAQKDLASGKDMAGIPGLEMQQAAYREMLAAQKALRNAGEITHGEYIKSFEDIRNSVREVGDALTQLRKNTRDAGAAAKSATGESDLVAKLRAEYDSLGSSIASLSGSEADLVLKRNLMKDQLAVISKLMKQQGGDTEELRRQHSALIQEYAKLDSQVSGVLRKWGRSFKDLVKYQMEWYMGTTIVLGGMMAFGKEIGDAFEFTQAIKDAGAIVGATESEMTKLSEAAIKIGETTVLGANEASEALKILGQTGLDAEQSIAALEVTARLMTATGAKVEEVVKGMTTAMQVWDYSSNELGDVGNIMAATMNASKLEMKDLGTIFNYLASTSEQVGYSLEETSAAMAVLSNRGVSASTIGTGLSNVFSSLISPTTRAAKVLEEFGIGLDEVSPYSHKFADIIERIVSSGMQVSDVFSAFNKREARILATAMNAGADAFRNMEGRVTNTNAALEVYTESMEGAKNQFILLGNEISNIFNESIGKSGDMLGALAKTLRTVVLTMRDAGPAILVVNGALFAMSSLSKTAGAGMLGVSAALKGAYAALGPWGTAAAILTTVIAAYHAFHKTSEEHIKDLQEQADASVVSIERARQHKAAFTDYLTSAEKVKDNDSEVIALRNKVIAQYPGIIAFLEKESESANENTTEYEKLVAALRAYQQAKDAEIRAGVSNYFADQAKQLKLYREEAEAARRAQQGLANAGQDAFPTTAPSDLSDEYDGAISARLKDRERELATQISNTQNSIRGRLQEMADKVKTYLAAGLSREEITSIMKGQFPDAGDVDSIMSFYDDMVVKVKKGGDRVKSSVITDLEGVKKKIKELSSEYESSSQTRGNYYDTVLQKIRETGKTEAEAAEASILVNKLKAGDLLDIAEMEYNRSKMYLSQIKGDEVAKNKELFDLEQDYAKKKETIWKELQGNLKAISQATVAQIDNYYASSVTAYETKMSNAMEKLEWDRANAINKTAGPQKVDTTFQAEQKYQTASLRMAKDAAEQKVRMAREEAASKQQALISIMGSEKKVHDTLTDITKSSISKQIGYYKELKATIMAAYNAALDKVEQLREKEQSLRKAADDRLNKNKDQFRSDDSTAKTIETAKLVASKAQKEIMKGTESGFEEGIKKLDKAIEALKGIDLGGDEVSENVKRDVLALIDADTKMAAMAEKRYADFTARQRQEEQSKADKLYADNLALNKKISDLEKQQQALDVPVKITVTDENREEIRKRLMEGMPEVPITIVPEANHEKLQAELEKSIYKVSVLPVITGEDQVEVPQRIKPRIPSIPTVDEEGLQSLRNELNGITTESQHNVNMTNRVEVDDFIKSIREDIVTKWTVYKSVVTVGDQQGADNLRPSPDQEAVEAYATGGFLGGYGGGDRIRALLEAGEYVVRKEAVRFYGKDVIDAINRMQIPRERRYSEGGSVAPAPAGKQDTIVARIQLDDVDYPIEITQSSRVAFEGFVDRLGKEKLTRRKRVS